MGVNHIDQIVADRKHVSPGAEILLQTLRRPELESELRVLTGDWIRRNRGEFEDWTDPEPQRSAQTAVLRPRPRPVEAAPNDAAVRVHLVVPRSFNDAQQIADKFKEGTPVILNLQGSDSDLSKRLIDFGSGLTYALDGGMQRVADKVFLLTPRNVEVSAEERARMLERGGFFNQA